MTHKRTWPSLAIISGILIVLFGGFFITVYILEAVIKRMGEPDQSLLFWYFPFMIMGLLGVIIGTVLTTWGAFRLKKLNQGEN